MLEYLGDPGLYTHFESLFQRTVGQDILASVGEWTKAKGSVQKGYKMQSLYERLRSSYQLYYLGSASLGSVLEHEQLMYLTLSGLAGKFYRDHLDHMLRTLLLASAVVQKLGREAGLSFDSLDKDVLLLSCLLHDIALPIQEATEVFQSIGESLTRSFKFVKFGKPAVEFVASARIGELFENLVKLNQKSHLIDLDNIALFRLLHEKLLAMNHGVLSAVAVCPRQPDLSNRYGQELNKALLAIALHDLDVSVDLRCFPDLYLLILSDTLQDWGRPIGHGMQVLTDTIGMSVEKNRGPLIRFHVDYTSATPPFDVFKQLGSKNKLAALKSDTLNLQASFKIPKDACEVDLKGNAITELSLTNSKGESEWHVRLSSGQYLNLAEATEWFKQILPPKAGDFWDTIDFADLLINVASSNNQILEDILERLGESVRAPAGRHGGDLFQLCEMLLKNEKTLERCSNSAKVFKWLRDALRELTRSMFRGQVTAGAVGDLEREFERAVIRMGGGDLLDYPPYYSQW